jgi:hypothetical protein
MEVVGVVFIASNHLVVVAPILSTADGPRPWSGPSDPAHQRLRVFLVFQRPNGPCLRPDGP